MSSVNRATVLAVSTMDPQNLSPSQEPPNILAVGEGRESSMRFCLVPLYSTAHLAETSTCDISIFKVVVITSPSFYTQVFVFSLCQPIICNIFVCFI